MTTKCEVCVKQDTPNLQIAGGIICLCRKRGIRGILSNGITTALYLSFANNQLINHFNRVHTS